jgi:hypothetical protein
MTFTLSFLTDPQTRFPLIKIPGLNFALFWLPVTKVQIEYFLSETIDSRFDRAWYHERLRNNPRIVPEQITTQYLVRAFLTHITFYEARAFSQWYGRGFDLPTAEEWQRALYTLDQIEANNSFIEQLVNLPDIHPRARLLVRFSENALQGFQHVKDVSQRRLSHQLMLRSGILEYVYQDATRNSCGACGRDNRQGAFQPLRHPDTGDRIPNLGLRPILRLSQ